MIDIVAGARPNLVKVSPILREMRRRSIPHRFVWTAQHDGALDLRQELDLPVPDVDFSDKPPEVRRSLDALSMLLTGTWKPAPFARWRWPDAVVVVGDVTSTLAAAMAATAHGLPVVHVEAGLRSGDFEMPEERNRIIVDRLSDLLLCTERSALDRLRSELRLGVWHAEFCGNVMVDSLRWAEARIAEDGAGHAAQLQDLADRLGMPVNAPKPYALVTLHRPSNVDTVEAWERSCRAIDAIRTKIPVVWISHPRAHVKFTMGRLPPMPYVEMVRLMKNATLVATDSGGVQEETTALGIPCLTLRENTERPVTVDVGTNTVVGLDPGRIGAEVDKILAGHGKLGSLPEGWDGHAAERIVDAIVRRYP